jgi:hypothetical protein
VIFLLGTAGINLSESTTLTQDTRISSFKTQIPVVGIPGVDELEILNDGPWTRNDDISPGLAAMMCGRPVGRIQQSGNILITTKNICLYFSKNLFLGRKREQTSRKLLGLQCFSWRVIHSLIFKEHFFLNSSVIIRLLKKKKHVFWKQWHGVFWWKFFPTVWFPLQRYWSGLFLMTKSYHLPLLRIRDVHPGSWFLLIPDLGSNNSNKRGRKICL